MSPPKHSQVRPDNAVLYAWQACNPTRPWPTELGEFSDPEIPDNSPPIRHRTIKQDRKAAPAVQAAA
jgi:hypothetical protein